MQLFFVLALSSLALANAGDGAGVKGGLKVKVKDAAEDEVGAPFLLPLERETVPVHKNGQVVSLKTAYSGKISMGSPVAQEFNVVFDTGSGHVVVPSLSCESDTCQAHKRYNITKSPKAVPLNADGEKVPEDELCDQATIGYGTGTITGEFVHDLVCLGGSSSVAKPRSLKDTQKKDQVCTQLNMVVAVEMSAKPFESYKFDGIFGLGLDSLALSPQFSFFSRFAEQSKKQARFAFFLSDGERGEQSEIAVGGHNADRHVGSLAWAPVATPKLGFWNVKIRSVRIGDVDIADCKNGGCNGILDTGTSHLGVPSHHMKTVTDLLTKDVAGDTDCRFAEAPNLSIDINGFIITLRPKDYMQSTGTPAISSALPGPAVTQDSAGVALQDSSKMRHCQPRVMPVDMKKPLGPNLFILGEPVLHRYYTVYDWHAKRVGFGLAKSNRNRVRKTTSTAEVTIKAEALDALEDEEEEIYLMQMSVSISLC